MWLAMTFATGLLGGAWRQVWYLEQGRGLTNPVSFPPAVSAVFSVLMIAVSLGIVAVCYGILVAWFWHMIPFPAAQD